MVTLDDTDSGSLVYVHMAARRGVTVTRDAERVDRYRNDVEPGMFYRGAGEAAMVGLRAAGKLTEAEQVDCGFLNRHGYRADSVGRAIKQSRKPIGRRESRAIHRLLQGR